MTTLSKIGNSQGVRIPKALIAQARLENTRIVFEVVKEGLLLKPSKPSSRTEWEKNIKELSKGKDSGLLEDMLDDSDLEDLPW